MTNQDTHDGSPNDVQTQPGVSPTNIGFPAPYAPVNSPLASSPPARVSLDAKFPLPTPDEPSKTVVDVYSATLPAWRAAIRRQLVKRVEIESVYIARIQELVRSPFLDAYFVYTSSLGTHTFFLLFLPALFFFGYDDLGVGLVTILALGVYASSFVKDLICSPRPLAPPVTRLTIGTHHLEYGFPSTHSTNSVSLALFLYSNLPEDSPFYTTACIILSTYAVSIVLGRIYTAMHSFVDCIFGVLLGTAIWAGWVYLGAAFFDWVGTAGIYVPLIVIPLALVVVHKHPEPVDDCPCFEDAIAFVSVLMGITVARSHAAAYGFDAQSSFYTPMLGSSEETNSVIPIYWAVAAAKMVVGILIIFVWRIAAKMLSHLILPPIFRLLATEFELPHRRFYTPATDYKNVPPQLGLHPIPSVMDLPGSLGMESEVNDWANQVSGREDARTGLKMRSIYGSGHANGNMPDPLRSTKEHSNLRSYELETNGGKNEGPVKHYDADVLTKVIVYAGIGILASEIIPIFFELVGWGVLA